jgi:PBSX family phage terminase large subunit
MTYSVILEDPPDGTGYEPRGAARKLWKCKAHEVMLSGPAETGKTLCSLQKLDALMLKYPGAQAAIIRKTRKSMTGSVLQTFENKVIRPEEGIVPYGGKHVEWYDYPNGSRIFVGGMDNPDKVLSSERDFIYINQSEELTLDDWEKLTTRCTGRAGNTPYAQIFGDCNPGPSNHWILQRVKEGALKFIESRHEDNPVLFNESGEITEQGKISIGILDALTGVRYHRLRHGRWVSAEGVIYESWDRSVHLIPAFPIPKDWVRFRSVDFGFTNPFVCQWWAEDPDGRMFMYREIYKTQLLVEDAGKEIKRLSAGETIEATVCDHDAEDRATLEKHGEFSTIAANKAVKTGIEAVQVRLRKAGDGRPRLYIFQDSIVESDKRLIDVKKPYCTEQEIESYIWEPAGEGRSAKETPKKVDDHGMDPLRYAVMYREHADNSYLATMSTR